MADVITALQSSTQVGRKTEINLQNLEVREELLRILLENEQMRLVVWLYPLDHERRHIFSSQSGKNLQEVRPSWSVKERVLSFAAISVCHWDCLGGTS